VIKPFEASIITTSGGGVLIDKISFKTEDGSKFDITAVGKYNVQQPQIIGRLTSDGNRLETTLKMLGFNTKNIKKDNNILRDFEITSDIIIQNDNIYFENINLSFDKYLARGRLVVLFGKGVPEFYYDFGMSQFKLSDYYEYTGDSFLNGDQLRSKLLYLNNFNSNKEVKLSFNNLIYNDKSMDNFKIDVKSATKYIKVENFATTYRNSNINGDMEISIASDTPVMNLKLYSKDIAENQNQAKNTVPVATETQKKIDYKKLFFNFPSAEQINGSFLVIADSLNIENNTVKNLSFRAIMLNGKVQIDTFAFGLFDGSFSITGDFDLSRIKGLNIAFSGGEINNKKLLDSLLGISTIDGVTSASGIVNGYGYDWAPFKNNIDIRTKFKSGGVKIMNFGFDSLVDKTKTLIITKSIPQELNNPENLVIAKGEVTTLDNIDGTFVMSNGDLMNFRFDIQDGIDIAGNDVGSIDFKSGGIISTATNLTFNAGTNENRIPLSIAIANEGKIGGTMTSNVNVDQIKKYIEQVKNLGVLNNKEASEQ
jgi:hypothetical protein